VSENSERFLIVAVDRDGDMEAKTGIRSPLYGKETMLAAATKLAIADPEEADANAMFAAVREFDRLKASSVECEVAVVCGRMEGGFEADRKIRRELEFLLGREDYAGIVLVSDGAEDELIIPVVQSLKPITSIVRIVIKHSRTVEESYLILGRYLRMLVFDSRYSRWAIGVPGIMFILAGILILLNRTAEAALAILLILGSAAFVRGFNIDRFIAGVLTHRPSGYVRLFSIVATILIFLVALSSGSSYMVSVAPNQVAAVSTSPTAFLVYGPLLVGYFLQGSIALIWTSFGVYLVGGILANLSRGSLRLWRSAVALVILGLLYLPVNQFSDFLISGGRGSSVLLVTYVLLGLAVLFGVATVVYGRVRSRAATTRE